MLDRIRREISYCFTYEPGETCYGASGRKLRRTCIHCPCYQKKIKKTEEKDHEKDH